MYSRYPSIRFGKIFNGVPMIRNKESWAWVPLKEVINNWSTLLGTTVKNKKKVERGC